MSDQTQDLGVINAAPNSVGPVTMAPVKREVRLPSDRKSRKLTGRIVAGEFGMVTLLEAMKRSSGMSYKAIAQKMGIQRESLLQYFYHKKGTGGTSRLEWFLRYAEATGCTVWLTFPSLKEQLQLQTESGSRKPGNPNWVKKNAASL